MTKTPSLTSVPDGWEIRTVGSLGNVMGGKRLPAGRSLTDLVTPFPYVRVADMFPGGVEMSTIRFVPLEIAPAISRYRINRDDVFISVAGTLGIVGRVPPELDGANLTENADRITGLSCDPNYLMYYLMSGPIQNEIKMIRTVGAQPKLALGRIKKFQIRIPKLRTEQRRVATALRDVDCLIEKVEELTSKKEAIKQGLLHRLISGEERLSGFSHPWQEKKVEDLCAPVMERTRPQALPPETPLVELEHIESGRGQLRTMSTTKSAISLKTVFRPGDVLFGKLRAYLRKYWLADINGACSTEFWVLRPKESAVSSFIRYLVETDRFIAAATESYGTHMPRSDWGFVRSLRFEVPPPEEQEAIASVLSIAERECSLLYERAVKLRDLKEGMMQELLSGRTRLPIEEGALA